MLAVLTVYLHVYNVKKNSTVINSHFHILETKLIACLYTQVVNLNSQILTVGLLLNSFITSKLELGRIHNVYAGESSYDHDGPVDQYPSCLRFTV